MSDEYMDAMGQCPECGNQLWAGESHDCTRKKVEDLQIIPASKKFPPYIDVPQLLIDVAENLYFRAADAFSRKDEYMALKGMQHAIEDALEKHGIKTFARPGKKG